MAQGIDIADSVALGANVNYEQLLNGIAAATEICPGLGVSFPGRKLSTPTGAPAWRIVIGNAASLRHGKIIGHRKDAMATATLTSKGRRARLGPRDRLRER
jgi:Na+-transporting NADH:ubiquinone oxidoreductase subunit NqrC